MDSPADTAHKLAVANNARLFKLEDIPTVMTGVKGWPMSAAMMRRWFNNPGSEMSRAVKNGDSPPSKLNTKELDETSIKMSWVLSFQRVRDRFEELQKTEIWATTKGLNLLKTRIDRQNLGRKSHRWTFGDLSQPAKVVDETCQVNKIEVGSRFDPMDDFYGAIGIALLKIAVSGMVDTDDKGNHSIEINEFGIYLRDTYEFNDGDDWCSQNLGDWGWGGVQPSILPRMDIALDDVKMDPKAYRDTFFAVENDNFREFRQRKNRGGDFVILSDVHRIKLATPLKFKL